MMLHLEHELELQESIFNLKDQNYENLLFLTCLFDTQDHCMKNKLNREKVHYPQCTGSQSYIAKAYVWVRKKSLLTYLHKVSFNIFISS
jgi:hypothetical protein